MTSERPLLALDSSTRSATVAVGGGAGVLAELSFAVAGGHSTSLLAAADHVLRLAGVERGMLGAVVVGGGPGSFTGLRIAAATAKGIVAGLGLPLFAYSSLLVTAARGIGSGGSICALLDARGRDLYAATYQFEPDLRVIRAPAAVDLDQLVEDAGGDLPELLVGDGATRHREELERRLGARVLDQAFATPRAGALLWLATRHPAAGLVSVPARWQPDYLRPSGAERIAAARVQGELPT